MSPSPKGYRFLAVIWKQDGYIDLFPEWALCASLPNLVHEVRGPNGGRDLADCAVEVTGTGTRADLTYLKSGLNARWHLGTLSINDLTGSNPNVSWVNEDGTSDDEDVGLAVWLDDLTGSIAEDILGMLRLKAGDRDSTSIRALIDARLGQGKFRADLDLEWQSRCAVTGVSIRELLRASHIRPWRDSDDRSRTDPSNGLLLAAHIDALFDKHLISFDDSGILISSGRLRPDDLAALGLGSARLRHVRDKVKPYLAHHRGKLLS